MVFYPTPRRLRSGLFKMGRSGIRWPQLLPSGKARSASEGELAGRIIESHRHKPGLCTPSYCGDGFLSHAPSLALFDVAILVCLES